MERKKPTDWPPPYRLKENSRARRVILRIRPDAGLVLTVPKGFDRAELPRILEVHRLWIQKNLTAAQEHPDKILSPEILPEKISLRAVDETWDVFYDLEPHARLQATWIAEPKPHIRIRGDVLQVPGCCRLLRTWLQAQGKLRLPPWVEKIGRETGLSYGRLTIRCPRTRWGSYSSRGHLSLNAAVLFLPAQLARLVIVHELCHSKHLHHDGAFHRLLERFEPDARRLEAQLKRQENEFPLWYRASFL
ncbi:MAG: SprT family zinc-dependent metalloprotease [Desulfosoma sp.]